MARTEQPDLCLLARSLSSPPDRTAAALVLFGTRDAVSDPAESPACLVSLTRPAQQAR